MVFTSYILYQYMYFFFVCIFVCIYEMRWGFAPWRFVSLADGKRKRGVRLVGVDHTYVGTSRADGSPRSPAAAARHGTARHRSPTRVSALRRGSRERWGLGSSVKRGCRVASFFFMLVL